jgi:hypothetical protein
MTHATDRFDWGAMYYRGIALGFDEGYAAYRANRAEQRWLRSRQGESPSGTTSEQVASAPKGSACESPALPLRRGDKHEV